MRDSPEIYARLHVISGQKAPSRTEIDKSVHSFQLHSCENAAVQLKVGLGEAFIRRKDSMRLMIHVRRRTF